MSKNYFSVTFKNGSSVGTATPRWGGIVSERLVFISIQTEQAHIHSGQVCVKSSSGVHRPGSSKQYLRESPAKNTGDVYTLNNLPSPPLRPMHACIQMCVILPPSSIKVKIRSQSWACSDIHYLLENRGLLWVYLLYFCRSSTSESRTTMLLTLRGETSLCNINSFLIVCFSHDKSGTPDYSFLISSCILYKGILICAKSKILMQHALFSLVIFLCSHNIRLESLPAHCFGGYYQPLPIKWVVMVPSLCLATPIPRRNISNLLEAQSCSSSTKHGYMDYIMQPSSWISFQLVTCQ